MTLFDRSFILAALGWTYPASGMPLAGIRLMIAPTLRNK
jgi:hypothetical protein